MKRKTSQPTKKWWGKWQGGLAFVIVLLTVLSMSLELPEKIIDTWQLIFNKSTNTISLKGVVTDSLNNMPIGGAVVKLDKLPGDSIITSSDGSFKFDKVPGKVGDDVRIYVFAPGYNPRNEYKILPGPVDIKLGKNE